MSKTRVKRTASQIQILLSDLLYREIQDPRLKNITITDIRLDRELQHADIYVNALGDENRQTEVMAALKKAESFIRRTLGQKLRLRTVPQCHFHWDPTMEHAEQIHQLLDQLDIPAAELPSENDTPDDGGDDESL